MSKKLIAAVVGCTALAAGSMNEAQAFEGGVSPYPAGAVGTNIANMPPIPGLFALEQFNYSFANGLYGNDGKKLPIPFKTSVFSETTRLLVAYPFHLLGGNVYTQLVVPVVSLHTSVFGQSNTQNGLSNITLTPVLLEWRLSPNLAIASGIDFAFETGSYSPVKPSVAVGYTSIQQRAQRPRRRPCEPPASEHEERHDELQLRRRLRRRIQRRLELRPMEARRSRRVSEPIQRRQGQRRERG
jgi:hypothetical protein